MSLNGNTDSSNNEIQRHEDNIGYLNSELNRLAESIQDLQWSHGGHHSDNVSTESENSTFHTEKETTMHILNKNNSAAGIFCWLRVNYLTQALNLTLLKDVVGIVATLARVESDELSRILSEYLGLGTMLAIVCNTQEGVKALEEYDTEGKVNYNVGLHGLACAMGRRINGRFIALCLEDFRPFVGGFVENDPQKKLALPKPRLPNGECPTGFLHYAVNMIHLNSKNLSYFTARGHGLRETLFYGLFSRLQIYKTRNEMLLALPCITDGALSLDGGMIKKCGMFALGRRNDVEVRFPLISGESDAPPNYTQAEDMVRKLKWESSKVVEDIQREQQLLDYEKRNFSSQF